MSLGVSVIVCCFNSAKRIEATLDSLWRQLPLDHGVIEVILVDNNCTDETVTVARSSHSRAKPECSLKIVAEPIPGLTSARITGIRHANFDTIIFCDDDNWLDSNYCQVAQRLLIRFPEIGLAGGNSTAVPEVSPPAWFESISGAWAVGQSNYQGYLRGSDAFLRGAGLVVRRTFFLALLDSGFRFISSDRRGKSLHSGGDAEISRAFSLLGYELYYDRQLHLRHWIQANRLNREYALKLWEGFGAGTIPTDAERHVANRSQVFRNHIRASWIYQTVRGIFNLVLLSHKHPIFFQDDPRPALPWCSQKGRIAAIWTLKGAYRENLRDRISWLQKNSETCSLKTGSTGR